jgi:hypothetical protein
VGYPSREIDIFGVCWWSEQRQSAPQASPGQDHQATRQKARQTVDLRIGQLVDIPNCIVSAVLPLDIFVD